MVRIKKHFPPSVLRINYCLLKHSIYYQKHSFNIIECVSRIWTNLTWLNLLMVVRLELIFTNVPSASKITLASKVVKSDPIIFISLCYSKSVTHSVERDADKVHKINLRTTITRFTIFSSSGH